jgi:hypothetical protein
MKTIDAFCAAAVAIAILLTVLLFVLTHQPPRVGLNVTIHEIAPPRTSGHPINAFEPP